MYLSEHADKEGKCFPAIGTIAGELKLSKSTVKRALQDLEKSVITMNHGMVHGGLCREGIIL